MNTTGRAAAANEVVLLLLGTLLSGCHTKSIETDEPNAALHACCDEARERIAVVRDVRTDTFRRDCQACRRGNPTGRCQSGASNVQAMVKRAYGENDWPTACDTLREDLSKHGISIPRPH